MNSNCLSCDVSRCQANCCGPVPIPNATYKRFKHLLVPGLIQQNGVFPGHTLVFDKDTLTCGFLSPEKKCMIYDDRPDVCKKFGDPGETHELLQCPYKRKWAEEAVK